MDKMNYSKLKEDSIKTTTVVVVFCDFQPPHVGHRVLIDYAKSYALSHGYSYTIAPSNSTSPLSNTRKRVWLNLMYPNTNIDKESYQDYPHVLKELSKRYTSIAVVCDKQQEGILTNVLDELNLFQKTQVISCVDKNPDANLTGWSNSRMIKYVKDGNYGMFKLGVPMLNATQSLTLFNELSATLSARQIHSSLETVRENYKNGMYKINDVVRDVDGVYKILERGSNHLIVVAEDGTTKRKWYESMTIINEDFNLNIAISQGGITYNGYTSSNLNLSIGLVKALGEVIDAYDDTAPLSVLNLIKACDVFCGLIKASYPEYSPTSKEEAAQWSSAIRNLEKSSKRVGFVWFDDIINSYKDEIEDLQETKKISTKSFLKKIDDASSPALPDTDDETLDDAEAEDRKTDLKAGSTLVRKGGGDGLRHRIVRHHYIDEELDDVDFDELLDQLDNELDGLVDNVSDDDVLDLYHPDEFALVDDDGNHLENLGDGEEQVDEVLSRQGRIKAKMRFRMSQSKRLRKAKLALHRRSTTQNLQKKAMRLATRTLKMRMAKKDLAKLSISEKERLERAMQKKHKVVERLAKRMVSRIRKTENQRLTHRNYTK